MICFKYYISTLLKYFSVPQTFFNNVKLNRNGLQEYEMYQYMHKCVYPLPIQAVFDSMNPRSHWHDKSELSIRFPPVNVHVSPRGRPDQ